MCIARLLLCLLQNCRVCAYALKLPQRSVMHEWMEQIHSAHILNIAHRRCYMAFAVLGYLYCTESIANMQRTGSSSDFALWPPQCNFNLVSSSSLSGVKQSSGGCLDQNSIIRLTFVREFPSLVLDIHCPPFDSPSLSRPPHSERSIISG